MIDSRRYAHITVKRTAPRGIEYHRQSVRKTNGAKEGKQERAGSRSGWLPKVLCANNQQPLISEDDKPHLESV